MSAFTEANRKAFNDLSATYNTKPWQHVISNQVADALRARKDWLGVTWADPDHTLTDQSPVKLLDYACGTGAITQALGPWVTQILGIDISENMVARFNDTAQNSGLSASHAHAVVGDLCAETPPSADLSGPDFHDFDVAVIGLGFHHFEDPARALQRLTERLRPGAGVLVVIDFLPFTNPTATQGHNFPDMAHTIKHDGFTPERMRKLYEAATLVDFDMAVLEQPAVMELKTGTVERTLFVAKGRRPTADS